MQGRESSLADCFRYFIFLACTLKAAEETTVIDSGFLAWTYMAFNERYSGMADPVRRLALFLHPGYRLVGNQEKEFEGLTASGWGACQEEGPWVCQGSEHVEEQAIQSQS
ncbi:TPA: hypothetical protein ACH3X1_006124 [Trebouxia sp. C0004]